jgi:small subunit ribosomal protein S25e
MKEVPTYRVITTSSIVDRMKVNGSLARRAIAHLESEGLIKRVIHHNGQLLYTRASGAGKD